jgi:acetolactate synthase-1/2/3 large subunit
MARENLDVTVVIIANKSYEILKGELRNVGARHMGPKALSMLELRNPEINWAGMAQSYGMNAAPASDMKSFIDLFKAANNGKGPFLIELQV